MISKRNHAALRPLSLVALSLLGSWSCAEEIELPLDDERVQATRQSIAPDPATVGGGGICNYFSSWNGTRARIYHPANGSCAASETGPLVVILPGTGFAYTDYEDLQYHLARNGFISATVEVLAANTTPAAHEAAAEEAWEYVDDFLLTAWGKSGSIDETSIALVGHSRGADTVRYLADYLQPDPVVQVKSVVSLMPTSFSGELLTGHDTVGTMEIYGTDDGQVSWSGSTFHFDRSGNQNSQRDASVNFNTTYKAMKIVEDMNHLSPLDGFAGNDTVKGYVLAFLAAHNQGDTTWVEDYIRGDEVPGTWASPALTSYSDGFHRRVIDNFSDGAEANSTIGDTVTASNATMDVLDLGNFPATYAHDTEALWMWGANTNGTVTWNIPAAKGDTTGFTYLSLRIGAAAGPAPNDLRIQIRNGAGTWSPELRLSDYGVIAQPTTFCAGICTSRAVMATIRIPLVDFGAHDDVERVRFLFRGDSTVDTFIVDNLEFSE